MPTTKYIIAKKLEVCQKRCTQYPISIELSRIISGICYPAKDPPAKIELNPSLFFPLNLATLSTPSQISPPKLAKMNGELLHWISNSTLFPRHYTNQLTRPTSLVVRYPSDNCECRSNPLRTQIRFLFFLIPSLFV